MNKTKASISVPELKQLLHRLADSKKVNACIRLRMIGEMWMQNHMRVLKIEEHKLTLLDESNNKLNFIQSISSVMQFEIDNAFQEYQPHVHYHVVL